MTPSEKDAWEKVRARGHTRFILLGGVLRWGVLFGAISCGPFLYDIATHNAPKAVVWGMEADFVLFTLLLGYAAGEISWKRQEQAYQKFGENEPTA